MKMGIAKEQSNLTTINNCKSLIIIAMLIDLTLDVSVADTNGDPSK